MLYKSHDFAARMAKLTQTLVDDNFGELLFVPVLNSCIILYFRCLYEDLLVCDAVRSIVG